MNYFELYELPLSFQVDEVLVKQKFYELSKRFHPDFHINEPEEKQREILELSTINNQAYQVLSDPMKRIPYILELKGLLADGETYQLPQSFLMEMMEVNEVLMELEFDADAQSLKQISAQVADIERDLFNELKQCTEAFDHAAKAAQEKFLLKIKDIWYRQKYLLRIRDSLDKFALR